MERLTERNGKQILGKYGVAIFEVLERLAAYEDTGLSPAEVAELAQAKADGRLVVLPETGIGDLSDGYHTFNELYHHRAILFSVICNEHPDISWKSKLHHDGTMFDGMFIVGINTPEGQATYHYDIDPYWDMFRVPELSQAPKWDGHTPAQAIERIGRLTQPENKPLTNADRIRSMSDEELAEYIFGLGNGPENCDEHCAYQDDCNAEGFNYNTCIKACIKGVTDWLKQPVKEE